MRPPDDGPKGSAAHQKSVHDFGPGGTRTDIYGSPASSSNPPFDRRLFSQNPWSPPRSVQRGSMVQDKEFAKSVGGYPLKLQFLYNPLEISYSYEFNNEVTRPDKLTAAQLATPMNGFQGATTVAFNLFFDRMYDVIDGTQPQGVAVDAAAFQNMVGMPGGQGFLSLIPINVFFSAAVDVTKFIDNRWPAPLSTLFFYGYVSSAGITYTHFTEKMVPTRCVIQITMTQIITQSAIDTHWAAVPAAAAKPTTPAKPAAKPSALSKVPRPGTAGYGL